MTISFGDYLEKAVKNANIKVIPGWIDLSHYNSLGEKARKILCLNEKDFIILFIGRMAPIKGIEVLLKAVRVLISDLSNLKVVVLGH